MALAVITQHLLDALQLCVAESRMEIRGVKSRRRLEGHPSHPGAPIGAKKPDPSPQLKHENRCGNGSRSFLTGSRSGRRLSASGPTAGCPSPGSARGRCCAPVSAGTAAPPLPSPSPSPPLTRRTPSSCPSLPRAIASKTIQGSSHLTSQKAEHRASPKVAIKPQSPSMLQLQSERRSSSSLAAPLAVSTA